MENSGQGEGGEVVNDRSWRSELHNAWCPAYTLPLCRSESFHQSFFYPPSPIVYIIFTYILYFNKIDGDCRGSEFGEKKKRNDSDKLGSI